MKTTTHLERAGPQSAPARASIFRLGLIVSVVAAIAAVAIRALVDVPAVVILVPVVVIGFALSWHATGQALEDREP
jgi:hypothetical protein